MKILFVCTGNSARSQMAEGFARTCGKGKVKASSAGREPRGLNPAAVQAMRERGIDISHQESKVVSEEAARMMDYVITVCGHAAERCPILPPEVRRLHWPLDDPAQATGSADGIRDAFSRCRDDIERLVREFLAQVGGTSYTAREGWS